VRRHASALLLLPLLAAGCTDTAEGFPCPGTPVAVVAFSGLRSLAGCGPDAPAATVDAIYPASIAFTGTIAYAGSGAALCNTGPNAEPLVGTQPVADDIDVSLETRGALLGACNPRCAVTVLQRLKGTLLRGPLGDPSGFDGTLTDTAAIDASVTGADCTPCTSPCQATYQLTGVASGTR
jgi:hypothetical protein